MKVFIYDTIDEASDKALEVFEEAKAGGAKVFGLATGSTPELLYKKILKSDLDFSDSISINLDEYYTLGEDHPQSYHYFMKKHLFDHHPFKESHLPNGDAEDIQAEIDRFEQIIADHPIDLQLLGMGPNGHIGFNEPGTPFDNRTHLAELTDDTINANKRFFDAKEDVPTKAYSMGIGDILESKEILFMAFGPTKAEATKKFLEGPITVDVPATALRNHPNVTVILDKEAAKYLDEEY